MLNLKKTGMLVLIILLSFSLVNCGLLVDRHSEERCVERALDVSLENASLLENHRDHGYDGTLCYHAFSVPDGFEDQLSDQWKNGSAPAEAMEICNASSYQNGKRVINFPTVDGGLYYYEYFNDGENERIRLAVLDTDDNVLYYFFASGQAIIYPRNK